VDAPAPSAREVPDAPVAGYDQVITADEVAALLRMTPAWVYAETRRNRIPHMRLGRYFRYRRAAIEAWMSDLEEAAAVPSPTRARQRSADADRRQRGTRSGESVAWGRLNGGRTSS
jgi:excisionase family DNA binding protein